MKFFSQIINLHEKILSSITFDDELLKNCQKITKNITKTNAILTIADPLENNSNKDSLLYGIPYSLKDNISTKNIRTTGGSKFLENYIPCYDATVYKLLKSSGAKLIAKTNLDEFGLGGTGTFSAFGIVNNPYDEKRIAGGSSSGSAVAVATGASIFSIGTDTGDSIRHPASYCGIVGYKPSYGLISRYGVFPYAPSMDHVGIFANHVADVAIILDAIAQFDENDYTSIKSQTNFYNNLTEVKNKKIAIIKTGYEQAEKNVKQAFDEVINQLRLNGFSIDFIEFDSELLKSLDGIYKIISYAEASSCYANLTGIPFGCNLGGKDYQEIITHNRTKLLGNQLKRRFIIGSLATKKENFDELFTKAKKVRTLIINEISNIFNQYDAIVNPGASSIAPLIEDVNNNKWKTNICDDILMIANFAGIPSITIPYKKVDGLPFGINICCKLYDDQQLLNIAATMENILNDGGRND